MEADERCACGEWPVDEYGPRCPSCARPPDIYAILEICQAYQLGDAVTSQIDHLLTLHANPGMEDVWGLNLNAVERIQEKLMPVLRQHAPVAYQELGDAIEHWLEM